ncbi:MAG: septum formation initiator family protein [Crocinitomicaceae bacterium]|nr:septum formation initiator family protein [Crocinitomicaceae bacterium]
MKKKLTHFFRNKYIAASAIFLMWVCFFNDIDLFFIVRTRMELHSLNNEVRELEKKNIEARQSLTELSSNMSSLEKFARETYYMKRDNEDVYVFKERAD